MKKKIIITVLIALLAIAGVVYFTQKKIVRKETVKIGAVLPLTGNMASLGETGKIGLIFAQDYINNNNLCSEGKIEFVFCDGMGVPKNSINALNHLIDVEKVNIVFSIVSAVDVSFMPLQKDRNFLFVSHATHPLLSNVNSLFFRHSPTVIQEADLLQEYIGADTLKTVLLSMSDDYGIAFAELTKQRGFISANNILSFNANDQDYKTLCHKAIKDNPSKVLVCGNGKDLYKIVNALRENNYKNEIITTLGFKVGGAYDVIQNKVDITYVNFKSVDVDEKYNTLLNNYKNRFGKDMTLNEMIFFNSALLVVEAINETQDKNDINEVAKTLSSIRSFNGLGESISISNSNDILPQLEIYKNHK